MSHRNNWWHVFFVLRADGVSHELILTTLTWFQQTTSLNISIATAKHLTNARNKLTKNNKEIDNDIHGTPYPFVTANFHNFQRLTCS